MQQEILSTGTAPAAVMAGEAAKGKVRTQSTHRARTKYIFEENGVNYLVETAEGYCGRKRLSQRSSSIKKFQRMARVRERGFTKRVATTREVTIYGPAINAEST